MDKINITCKNNSYLGQTRWRCGRLFVRKLDQTNVQKQQNTALVCNGQDHTALGCKGKGQHNMTKTYKKHFYLGQTRWGSGRLFVKQLDQINIKKQHHTALVCNGQDKHNITKHEKNNSRLGQTRLGSGRLFVKKSDQTNIQKQQNTAEVCNRQDCTALAFKGQGQHNMTNIFKRHVYLGQTRSGIMKAFCQKVGPNQHQKAASYSTSECVMDKIIQH